VNKITQRRPS